VLYPSGRSSRVLVLPAPEDRPSGGLERRRGVRVAPLVGRDLLPPELGVGPGLSPMERAAVEEAAIYEHRETCAGEHHIRTPATTGKGCVVDAVPQPSTMELSPQRHLGDGVAASDGLHSTPDGRGRRRRRV
jgi:hypothetical protein